MLFRLTKFVVYFALWAFLLISQVLCQDLFCKPGAVRYGELILNVAKPTVGPSRRDGHQ